MMPGAGSLPPGSGTPLSHLLQEGTLPASIFLSVRELKTRDFWNPCYSIFRIMITGCFAFMTTSCTILPKKKS